MQAYTEAANRDARENTLDGRLINSLHDYDMFKNIRALRRSHQHFFPEVIPTVIKTRGISINPHTYKWFLYHNVFGFQLKVSGHGLETATMRLASLSIPHRLPTNVHCASFENKHVQVISRRRITTLFLDP